MTNVPRTIAENRRASLAENRRARFDYDILEIIEAGIELLGYEVKSAKAGRMNIAGSYAVLRRDQVWLINSQIPPYQPKNTPSDYDPARSRRLLLHKEEATALAGRLKEKFSIVPLKVYVKRGLIKLELGLGKPRKKSDKRELLKKRAAQREMRISE